MFKKLFRKSKPPPAPAMEQEIAAASGRFAKRMKDAGLDSADPIDSVEAFIESQRGDGATTPPADLASDLAAFLGEQVRVRLGGQWGEDPLFGVSILKPCNVSGAVMGPYQLARKKWQLGASLSLRNFFANLPGRVVAEANRPPCPLPSPTEITTPESEFAARCAEESRQILGRDLEVDIPATLVGLRTAERWLRGQFLLRTASRGEFDRLGFLVGEVMRGLYGGEWCFEKARESGDWADAELVFPELPFYPVGRVLKLLVEQPEGNGLDDYVRLVPAARRDLGKDEG